MLSEFAELLLRYLCPPLLVLSLVTGIFAVVNLRSDAALAFTLFLTMMGTAALAAIVAVFVMVVRKTASGG
jgi:Na+/H+-dicarboxylate symporter